MKQFLFVLIGLLPISLFSQHQLGWRTDTYAGINAAFINPAATARTPYSWDLNIAEANFFFSNNYAFIEDASVSSLIKAARNEKTDYVFRGDLPSDATPGAETVVYNFNDKSSYYVQKHISVLGPSLSFRVAPMTRIGLFSRWQFMTSAKDFDQNLGYDSWRTILDNVDFTLDQSQFTSAAWSEVGLNLTQGFQLSGGDLQIGVSVRKLSGKRAAYFVNKQDFTLSKLTDYTGLEGQEFDIETGFTNNALAEDNFNDSPGTGWGTDIGFLYQADLGDGFYRWEVGAALLDLGKLDFNDAQAHQFNNDLLSSTLSDRYNNLAGVTALDSLTQILSEDVLGDPLSSLQSESIQINLPTTLSFQFNYRFNEWMKVEGNLFINIAPKGASLSRSTTLAVTPRIDRHWWSVAAPVSYYAGEQLRLGLSARLGPLFIGTDQLSSLVKQKELNSSDFYVGVKFFPLGLDRNKKKKGKSGKSRGRGGKDVECYKF